MKRNQVLIAAAAVLLLIMALTMFGGGGPALPPLTKSAVVLAFGDSLTFGTGAGPSESYPAVLAQLIQRKVVNAGVSGEISGDGQKRLPALLKQHRPALLILCHGGNDFLENRPEQQTINNIRAMIREAKSQSVEVVLIGVPKKGLILSAPLFYEEIADEFEIPYEAKLIPRILSRSNLKADYVHPNSSGYRQIAERIAELLRDAGALPDAP